MTVRRFSRLKIAAAIALMLGLAGGTALASNMGFKHNHQILGTSPGGGAYNGLNIVSLPYQNPYTTAQDYCVAQNLPNGAQVIRSNRAAPTSWSPQVHLCGGGGAYTLVSGESLYVNKGSAGNLTGILVGSHVPATSITIFPKLALTPDPAYNGLNLFSVPYHTTRTDAQGICDEFGIASGTGTIIRSTGTAPVSHLCGGGGAFSLVLGEGVSINTNVQKTATPSHF